MIAGSRRPTSPAEPRGGLGCRSRGVRSREGRSSAACGAPAKGTTLLNYGGLGAGDIAYVVDRNPVKQGQLTPGTRIAIHPTQKLLDAMPDYVMLLAWNLADEVIAQQAEYRRRGGS